jgi:hypothetical protein
MKPDIRIEFPSVGATYNRPKYGVYKYGIYPRGSVLAGQESRTWLAEYDSLTAAQEEYPEAEVAECGYHPPDLSHLPGEDDDDNW